MIARKRQPIPYYERPMASPGLTSYRCRAPGNFDAWIMIGAKDHDDAMNEAWRSSDTARREDLEIWDGARYVPTSNPSTTTE